MNGISISTCFDYSIPFEEQLCMIRNAGFAFISFGSNYQHSGILHPVGLKNAVSAVRANGLAVDTVHGCNMDTEGAVDINTKAAIAARELGAPVVVLHCSSFAFDPSSLDERKKDISSKLRQYTEISKEFGVKFAFENLMPGAPTELCEYILKASDPKYFGFCYDSSHDQIGGPKPPDLLKRHIDRLTAVHISDRIKEFVDHVIPGEGFVNFDDIAWLMKNNSFEFPLLMEVMTTHSRYKDPLEFLSAAYSSAVKLLCHM